MPLTCFCSDEYDWYYTPNADFSTLKTKRSRKCCSCGERIAVGDTVLRFAIARPAKYDIEERIYGNDPMAVTLPDRFHCERCGGLFMALDDLGYCVDIEESMVELAREYGQMHSEKAR